MSLACDVTWFNDDYMRRAVQYTHSLTLELDSQRQAFEQELKRASKQLDRKRGELAAEVQRLEQDYSRLSQQLLATSAKQQELLAQVNQAQERLTKTQDQVAEETAYVAALTSGAVPQAPESPALGRLRNKLAALEAKRDALYAQL
eukprot:m.172622 g.172622  ORF g.172622 m.172622 type:complete len:146 (+) comp16723_c0_seq2:95-532(+)